MVTILQDNEIIQLYRLLAKKYGELVWWTHEAPFEIIIGAILVQNTNWLNAAKAIDNLKEKNLFSAEKINALTESQLIGFIKPAGLYNQKAPRVFALCNWYKNDDHFSKLKRKRISTLRKELIAIKGIGNETADAILLYAFRRPIFVIDKYTQRLLIENGLIKKEMKYEDLQLLFHHSLPLSAKLFSQYHALIIHHSQLKKKSSRKF
jgi:endonuclease-3 related protein